jgi:hypothetical protein
MRQRCLLPLLCALLVLTQTTRAAENADGPGPAVPDAPLTRGSHGQIQVPVDLNGQGPFLAMVDTGATHTSVSGDLAVRLGLPIVARAEVRTSAGVVIQPVAELARLTLAGMSDTSLLVSVVEPERLDPSRRVLISLGQDVLASRPFVLDFARHRFRWGSHLAGPRQTEAALEPSAGRFVAVLPQRESTLRLVVDSGSETLVLFERGGVPAVPLVASPALWLETVAGRRLVQPSIVRALHVGALTLRDLPAVTLPASAATADGIDGLLPLGIFGQVLFDGPGRRLTLTR